ncbi:G2/mitotic-specific cyclin-B [Neodiprion fabricii]|uniref:G2/mitotic-specific cyclin-B n=1 Tax=Neodiprion fabricii TaxID=2872261 RepID=UPI001ED90106|nr:G2/mitotic-specific cyclin-B [Neodiprion fabricii]
MALRSRPALVNIGNQENVANAKAKALGLGHTKRSALGEIGNKMNNLRGTRPMCKAGIQHDLPKKTTAKPATLESLKLTEKPHVELAKQLVRNEPSSPLVRPSIEQTPPPAHQQQTQQPDQVEKVSFSSDLLIEDIDQDDSGNPILVSIYSNDIYAHLRDLERQTPVEREFLTGQQVTPKMRSVLVDWLVEVHQQFHLTQETLYLTVAILDRFLQAYRSIDRKRLQLVGITAMFVASKYEEMYSPDINDFVYVTDNAYSKLEVLQMEMVMLRTLKYSFGRPLPLQFLRRYSKAGKALAVHHTMAKYFLEQGLINYDMCHYPPSLVAAAALYLSLFLIGSEEDAEEGKLVWTPTLVHYSTYKEEQVLPVVREIALYIINVEKSKHQAVRKKYTQSKHMKISLRSELKSPTMYDLATTKRQD